MDRIREARKDNRLSEYVDVKFEYLMHDIEAMMRDIREKMKSHTSEDRLERLKDVCRAIRATKLHFHTVLERYGANYENSAKHFVDLAYFAADFAATNTDCDELKGSLKRHAEEIENARIDAISRLTSATKSPHTPSRTRHATDSEGGKRRKATSPTSHPANRIRSPR